MLGVTNKRPNSFIEPHKSASCQLSNFPHFSLNCLYLWGKLRDFSKNAFLIQHYFVFLHQIYIINMEKKRLALRKLLEAVEKEILRKPDKKTLDRLSLLAGFQSWEEFQNALHGE